MKVNIEKKITILLVIKDRPDFTIRWLKYVNQVKIPFNIFIADGSINNDFYKELKKDTFNEINFKYKYFGFDKSPRDFYKKISSALSIIDTDYIMLADDDDFIITSSIMKSANFLEQNLDYVACGSDYAGIYPDDGDIYLLKNYSLKTTAVYNNSYFKKDALARITDIFKDFRSIHYDLYRKEIILKAYEQLIFSKEDDLFLHEFFLVANYLYHGKLKKLKGISLVRQHNNPLSAAHNISARKESSNLYSKKLIKKLPLFYENLSKSTGLNESLLQKKLDIHFRKILFELAKYPNGKSSYEKFLIYLLNPKSLMTYLKAKFAIIRIKNNSPTLLSRYNTNLYKLKEVINFLRIN